MFYRIVKKPVWGFILRYGRPFLISLVSILLSACEDSLGGQQSPQNYSCGDVSRGHCYAESFLGDHLTGFRSTFTVVGRFLAGDGFITNEFWLNNYNGTNGWIEIGYQANGIDSPKYFWAVLDPDTGFFKKYDIGPIPQEEMGTRVDFDIHQIAEDVFIISIEGTKTHFSTTVDINLWDGTYGGYAVLGQELAGSKGAVASLAEFVHNQVYDKNFKRRFATEIDSSSEKIDKPPYGGWLQKPAAGIEGGTFSTYCCAP